MKTLFHNINMGRKLNKDKRNNNQPHGRVPAAKVDTNFKAQRNNSYSYKQNTASRRNFDREGRHFNDSSQVDDHKDRHERRQYDSRDDAYRDSGPGRGMFGDKTKAHYSDNYEGDRHNRGGFRGDFHHGYRGRGHYGPGHQYGRGGYQYPPHHGFIPPGNFPPRDPNLFEARGPRPLLNMGNWNSSSHLSGPTCMDNNWHDDGLLGSAPPDFMIFSQHVQGTRQLPPQMNDGSFDDIYPAKVQNQGERSGRNSIEKISRSQSSDSTAEDSSHPPSELSLKTSHIIDCVLKGDKVNTATTSKPVSSETNIVDKAQQLCTQFREFRETTLLQKARLASLNILDHNDDDDDDVILVSTEKGRPPRVEKNTSQDSIRIQKPSNVNQPSTTCTNKRSTDSYISKISSPRAAACNSTQKMKDTVLKMIKYPKSRRGCEKIEKLLYRNKVSSASRMRLMNLVKPFSDGNTSSVELGELAPDVQQHILSWIDEFIEETPQPILLSDEDKSDENEVLLHFGSPASYKPTSTPCSSSQTSFLTDISPQLDSLLHEDADLMSILTGDEVTSSDINKAALDNSIDWDLTQEEKEATLVTDTEQATTIPACVTEGMRIVDRLISDFDKSYDEIKSDKICDKICDAPKSCDKTGISQNLPKTGGTNTLPDVTVPTPAIRLTEPPTTQTKKNMDPAKSNTTSCSELPVQSDIPQQMEPVSEGQQAPPSESDQVKMHSKKNPPTAVTEKTKDPSAYSNSILVMNQLNPVQVIKIEPLDLVETAEEEDPQNSTCSADTVIEAESFVSAAVATDSQVTMDTTHDSQGSGRAVGKRPRDHTVPDSVCIITPDVSESASTKRAKTWTEDSSHNSSCTSAHNDMVDELYSISLEEEQVREKISEADTAVRNLMELLEERKKHREKLKDRECCLRQRRLQLLKSAKEANLTHSNTLSSSSSIPDALSTQETVTSSGQLAGIPYLGQSIEQPGLASSSVSRTTSTKSASSTSSSQINSSSQPKCDSFSTKSNSTPPGVTSDRPPEPLFKKKVPVTTSEKTDDSERNRTAVDTEENSPTVTKSHSVLEKTSQSRSNSRDSVPHSQEDVAEYLGSLPNMDNVSSVIQQLAENFKHLKKTSYVWLNGEKLELSKQIDSQSELLNPGGTCDFKVPKSVPQKKTKSKQTAKQSPVRQTRATKKNSKGKVHLSKSRSKSCSSKSETETDQDQVDAKDSKVKRKRKEKGVSKVMKEYLHQSSSSDVELDDGPSKISQKPEKSSSKKSPQPGPFPIEIPGLGHLVIHEKLLLASGHKSPLYAFSRNKGHGINFTVDGHTCPIKVMHMTSGVDPQTSSREDFLITAADKEIVVTSKTGLYICSHYCEAPITCGDSGFWGRFYFGLSTGSVVVFDVKKSKIVKVLNVSRKMNALTHLCTAKEGSRKLLVLCEEGQSYITIRDANTNLFLRSLEGHLKPPLTLKVKNHVVYSGGPDNMLHIHNILTGDLEETVRFLSPVTCVAVAGVVVVGEKRGIITIVNMKYQKERIIYSHDHSPVSALAYDEPNKMVYVGAESGRIEAFSLQSEGLQCKYKTCRKSKEMFGHKSDLLHHLIREHIEPCSKDSQFGESNPLLLKCLWLDCDEFIQIKENSKDAEVHLSSHL